MAQGAARPAGGLRGYWEAMRSFSYNAKLYLIHIIGMDMIHGTWEVLFNLYLLAIGKSVAFVGLRLAIQGVAGVLMALPAGLVSDRIGRKRAFILGDGGGAALALVQIFATQDWLLLGAPVLAGFFGNLHGVTEPAFMAENSRRRERVHLFSVGAGLGVLAAAVGSFLTALDHIIQIDGLDQVTFYRYATLAGIIWWFLSLIPALLLRELTPEEKAAQAADEPAPVSRPAQAGPTRRGLLALFANIRNPRLVFQVVLVNGLIALGAGFGLRLMNVFMHNHVHAGHHEIGATFGAGQLLVAAGTLLVPFVVERFGKVGTVVLTRALSVPFILLFAFSPEVAGVTGPALTVAGMAFGMRLLMMNMGGPAAEAFEMEQLHPQERATAVGLQMALGSGAQALGVSLGAWWMANGQFSTPYVAMALFYALSTGLYWWFFRRAERRSQGQAAAEAMAD